MPQTFSSQWNTGTNNGTEQAKQRVKGTSPWTNFGTGVVTSGTSFLVTPAKTFTGADNTVYEVFVDSNIGCSSGIVEEIKFACPTITANASTSSATVSIPTNLTLDTIDFVLTGPVNATNNEVVTTTTTSTTFVGLTPGNYTVSVIMYSSAGDSASLSCTQTFTIATPACTSPTNLTVS